MAMSSSSDIVTPTTAAMVLLKTGGKRLASDMNRSKCRANRYPRQGTMDGGSPEALARADAGVNHYDAAPMPRSIQARVNLH